MREVGKTIYQVEHEEKVKDVLISQPTAHLLVTRNPDGLYSLSYSHGKEVPDSLKGRYTSAVRAEAAIVQYNFKDVS